MELKSFYKWLSIISIVFGGFLLINTQVTIAGFAINDSMLTTNSTVLWSAFFLIAGIALFVIQKKNK